MLRRELLGRRRYPAKTALDAHMAVGVDDHRAASGPELVERFALLWPRAVQTRRRRPGALRRSKINPGIPGQPRWPVAYLLDVILNRDLWMHRVDLARATGRTLVIGDHEQQIVTQVIRDLALAWSTVPVTAVGALVEPHLHTREDEYSIVTKGEIGFAPATGRSCSERAATSPSPVASCMRCGTPARSPPG